MIRRSPQAQQVINRVKINLEITDFLLTFVVETLWIMDKEHITLLPNKRYNNLKKETTNNLRCCETIQYGYIKLRDLQKWESGEVVSVKMGMLTPSKPAYKNLSIINAACKRISEQDTTALFEDEDELIPIYVFVSEITDNEWREHLIEKGYKSSRKTASREGIRIDRKNLFGEYGFFFNENTEESKSILEEKRAERERIKKVKEERFQESIKEYDKIYGEGSFKKDYERMSKKYGNVRYDIPNKVMFSEKTVTSVEALNADGITVFMICFFAVFTFLWIYWAFQCEWDFISGICVLLFVFNLLFTIVGVYNLDIQKIYDTKNVYARNREPIGFYNEIVILCNNNDYVK